MAARPGFFELKTYEEFEKYYWYREELSATCKRLGIEDSGSKLELNHNIKEYFQGHLVEKKKRKSSLKKTVTDITLQTPLLACGSGVAKGSKGE